MTKIQCVGIYYHPRLDEAREMADDVATTLQNLGREVWISAPWEPERSTDRLHETDLLICLGGDGTILRAARATVGHDCLILGVDLGRQAFLTELLPEQVDERIPDLLSGDFVVESRTMLEARPIGVEGDVPEVLPALNDVMFGVQSWTTGLHCSLGWRRPGRRSPRRRGGCRLGDGQHRILAVGRWTDLASAGT